MKKLINGIIEFREKSLKDYRAKYSELVAHQSPDALMVACCDSRVVPNLFASTDPGDLFVLRNVGNLVPPALYKTGCGIKEELSVATAIEYSLTVLSINDIIICGHSKCGAMQGLIEDKAKKGIDPNSCLKSWLNYAQSSYERFEFEIAKKTSRLDQYDFLSQINVLQQLDNLQTYPLVKKYIAEGKLQIHGWWFDITTADVYRHDQDSNRFVLIDR